MALSPLFGPLCAPCHGESGRGDGPAADLMWPRPADFARPSKLGDPARRIREGVPGTAMPAFSSLTDAQRDALTRDVLGFGGAQPEAVDLSDVAGPDPARGAALWASAGCGACHSDRPTLLDDQGRPADLYDLFTRPLKGGDRAEDLFVVLTRGRPGTPMRGRPDLPASDRWALARWILSRRATIDATPRLPPKAAPSVAREDLWQVFPTPPLKTPLPILQSRRADQCGRCHPQTWAQWRESRHAAATGPGLTGQYIGRPARFAKTCDRCHAPQASGPADAAHADGVSCVGCHIRGHGKLGNTATRPPGLQLRPTPRLQRSDMCMPCHNLPLSAAVAGAPLLDTWREWAASPYLPAGVQCQHCHIGQGDHRMAGAHDADAVRRAVTLSIDGPTIVDGVVELTVTLENTGAGHAFPTTATPRAVLRVRQRSGSARLDETALLWAIGRTVSNEGGRWRQIADTRIRPGARAVRRYRRPLADGADAIEVDLHFFPDWFYTRAFRAWLARSDVHGAARIAYQAALSAGDASVIRVDWRLLPLP